MKVRLIIIVSLVIIWGAISTFIMDDYLTLINIAFLSGLVSFIILAMMYISKSSLYHLFMNGFKSIKERLTPENRGMKRADKLIRNNVTHREFKEKVYSLVTITLFWIGTISTLFSLLVMFMTS